LRTASRSGPLTLPKPSACDEGASHLWLSRARTYPCGGGQGVMCPCQGLGCKRWL
jgi:hypothetical protein